MEHVQRRVSCHWNFQRRMAQFQVLRLVRQNSHHLEHKLNTNNLGQPNLFIFKELFRPHQDSADSNALLEHLVLH